MPRLERKNTLTVSAVTTVGSWAYREPFTTNVWHLLPWPTAVWPLEAVTAEIMTRPGCPFTGVRAVAWQSGKIVGLS